MSGGDGLINNWISVYWMLTNTIYNISKLLLVKWSYKLMKALNIIYCQFKQHITILTVLTSETNNTFYEVLSTNMSLAFTAWNRQFEYFIVLDRFWSGSVATYMPPPPLPDAFSSFSGRSCFCSMVTQQDRDVHWLFSNAYIH